MTTQKPPDSHTSLISRLFALLASLGKFQAPPAPPLRELSSNEMSAERTELSEHRTLMAADRTLMAWVRTALSMVSFGFTIYKILEGLQESGTALRAAAQPRVVALILIGLGNLSIVMGTLEYYETAKDLSRSTDVAIWRPSFTMAVLIAVLSLFLFFAVIFKAL